MRCIKRIDNPTFCTWINFLSLRDKMIAMLLYFGAPSLEEVLNLKVKDIDFEDRKISYPSVKVVLTISLMWSVREYCRPKKKNDYVFINRNGVRINRTHLNNSFKRASRKCNIEITPSKLMEIKRINIEGS